MLEFSIAALCMVLVAGSFFLPLLRGRGQRAAGDRSRLNMEIYRQRRGELVDEAGGGNLQALMDELDRGLLDELSVAPERAAIRPEGWEHTGLIAGLLLIPLFGALLYVYLGRPDLADYRARESANGEHRLTTAELQQGIARLVERLKNQPDDIEAWALLARSYQFTEQYDLALATWEKALIVAPENPDVMAAYAQILAEAHEGDLSGKPEQLVKTILEKDPNHPEALWLAGLLAAQQNRPADAIGYWQRLKAQLAEDSEPALQIAEHIAKLQAQTASPAAAAGKGSETVAGAKSIYVGVRLSESLAAQAHPDDTVFIFARAASGPPMPLAVVRKLVKDLPLEVTLDDSQAMRPSAKLSAFAEIIVGARISRKGQAMPASGDLQGLTAAVKPVTGGRYQVVIDQKLP